jgi:uncharacterized protein
MPEAENQQAGPAEAFHVLAKPAGAQCNPDCDYCFFLSKEMLYPDSRLRMSDEQLERYLRQLIEAHAGLREVTIAWQGGEPTLMGLDFYRLSVEIAERHLQPGQRALHTIQTNGTLIDAEWARFVRENGFLVGISIDGPRDIHDSHRVSRGGRGSFDREMQGLSHLRGAGVEFNTLTTLNAQSAGRGVEIYRFLRDECDSHFMQFIPIIERVQHADQDGTVPWSCWRDRPLYRQSGSHVSARSIGADQYGRLLIDVFEEWVRRDVGQRYVQMFDVALASWVGEPSGLCVHSPTCGRAALYLPRPRWRWVVGRRSWLGKPLCSQGALRMLAMGCGFSVPPQMSVPQKTTALRARVAANTCFAEAVAGRSRIGIAIGSGARAGGSR